MASPSAALLDRFKGFSGWNCKASFRAIQWFAFSWRAGWLCTFSFFAGFHKFSVSCLITELSVRLIMVITSPSHHVASFLFRLWLETVVGCIPFLGFWIFLIRVYDSSCSFWGFVQKNCRIQPNQELRNASSPSPNPVRPFFLRRIRDKWQRSIMRPFKSVAVPPPLSINQVLEL